MGILREHIIKTFEGIKDECGRHEDFLSSNQEDIIKYYLEFYFEESF